MPSLWLLLPLPRLQTWFLTTSKEHPRSLLFLSKGMVGSRPSVPGTASTDKNLSLFCGRQPVLYPWCRLPAWWAITPALDYISTLTISRIGGSSDPVDPIADSSICQRDIKEYVD